MNLWVGLAIAGFLLLLGMLGLLGGGIVVLQQVRHRSAVRAAKAKRAALVAQVPLMSTQVHSSSDRPTVPLMESPRRRRGAAPTPADAAPQPPPQSTTTASPTLLPDVDDFEEDVPTGVFRPSQYTDIEAMMKEADKYVSSHRRGS